MAQPPADLDGGVAGGGRAGQVQVLALDGRERTQQRHLGGLDWSAHEETSRENGIQEPNARMRAGWKNHF